MVISEIRSLYSDENDLRRTVIKHIYEDWDPNSRQWQLKKVVYIFDEPPVSSDTIEISVEHRHGWLIPPEWEFITEAWEYTRMDENNVRQECTYDHDSEVTVLDGDVPIIGK